MFETIYPPGIKRQKVSSKEVEEIQEFLLAACPVKSGESRTIKLSSGEQVPKHTQRMPDDELYHQYCVEFEKRVFIICLLLIF